MYSFHSSGRCALGSQPWWAERSETMRSLARLFSSSRRAPPKAASKPCLSSACLSPSVFHRSVCSEPWSNGLIPRASASGFLCTMRSKPSSRAIRSRISYIAWNFQVVSTCSSGKGGRLGKKALAARCSITAESLPTE